MSQIKPTIHNIVKLNTLQKQIKPLLLCCGLFFLISCTSQKNKIEQNSKVDVDTAILSATIDSNFYKIDSLKQLIQSGDLITRTGNDFTSESLKQLNQRDKRFSHCGIASIENDSVFVYHALGGEFNPNQQILREPIQSFGNPATNRCIGLFRYDLSVIEKNILIKTVKQLFDLGVTFDMKFDLETDKNMYCAEFVYKSLLLGTSGRLKFNISRINQFKFVGVDDLFLQPQCKELGTIILKSKNLKK